MGSVTLSVLDGMPKSFSSVNVLSNFLGVGFSHRYCRLHD